MSTDITMMKMRIPYIRTTVSAMLSLLLFWTSLHVKAATIGTWKAYMAYRDITEIAKGGNNFYVLASKSLYRYNTSDRCYLFRDSANCRS